MSAVRYSPPFFVGIDLGGTNIKSGVVDNEGRSLLSVSIETHAEDGPIAGVDSLAAAANKAVAESGINGIESRPSASARPVRWTSPQACCSIRPICRAGTTFRSASASPIDFKIRPHFRMMPTQLHTANSGWWPERTIAARSCSRWARGSAAELWLTA